MVAIFRTAFRAASRRWQVEVSPVGVQYDGLLPRGDDAAERLQHAAVDHLVEDEPRLRVHRLLRRRPLRLVVHARPPLRVLDGKVAYLVVDRVGELHVEAAAVARLDARRELHDALPVLPLALLSVVLGDDGAVGRPPVAAAGQVLRRGGGVVALVRVPLAHSVVHGEVLVLVAVLLVPHRAVRDHLVLGVVHAHLAAAVAVPLLVGEGGVVLAVELHLQHLRDQQVVRALLAVAVLGGFKWYCSCCCGLCPTLRLSRPFMSCHPLLFLCHLKSQLLRHHVGQRRHRRGG